jgi:hypothetical protein
LRFQVARVALEAALAVDGVSAYAGGLRSLRMTQSGSECLVGVVCAADPCGGYAVSLYLVVRLEPLPALAARVRSQVYGCISAAGLADELARLDIIFEDIVDREG